MDIDWEEIFSIRKWLRIIGMAVFFLLIYKLSEYVTGLWYPERIWTLNKLVTWFFCFIPPIVAAIVFLGLSVGIEGVGGIFAGLGAGLLAAAVMYGVTFFFYLIGVIIVFALEVLGFVGFTVLISLLCGGGAGTAIIIIII